LARRNRLGIDFLVLLAGQAMMVLQGIIVLPFVIKLAGEATYGAYVLLLSLVGWLFSLLGCGIPYRYQRNLVSAASFEERRELFEPQFTFQIIVVAGISAAAILVGARFETWLFGGVTYFSVWLLVIYLFVRLANKQGLDYFQYTQRFLPLSLTLSGNPYLFVALLALVAFGHKHLTLDTLLALQIVSTAAISLPILSILVREIGIPRLRLPLGLLISDTKLGLPLMLELTIDFLLRSSDRYLILAFLSVADVGIYQPAYTVGSLAIFFVTLTETILLPTLSRLVDAGERDVAQDLTTMFQRLFVIVGVPMVVGSLLMGPSLIGLLTTPAIGLASAWVTPLIALATVFYGIARLASTVAYVLRRTMLILWANVAGAGVTIGLNLILLPLLHNITASGLAAAVGQFVNCLYVLLALRSVWRFPVNLSATIRCCGAAGVMAGVLLALGFRPGDVSSSGVASLAVGLALAIPAYFGALLLLGGIRQRDWMQLKNLASRRFD
jgi:O-antigen/teichoic acid export membrane protein